MGYAEEEIFADESAYLKTATAFGIVGRKDLLLPLAHRRSYIEYVKGKAGNINVEYWSSPEGQQEYAYWQSPNGQAAFASIEGPSQLLKSLTDLVTAYSDASIVECLKKQYGSLRDFIETSSPTTQCGNTIRGVVPNMTQCWICGTKITGYPGAGVFKSLELTPECEHVFPIAQAICFAGLYETQLYKQIAEIKGITAAESYREGVSYEYQWAHRICNQIKNDTHFIVYDGNRFSINEGMLVNFLKDLQTTNKYGGGPLLMQYVKQELNITPENWLYAATIRMRDISNRLIEYANTSGLTPEQHAKVTLMSLRSYIAMSPVCAGAVEQIPAVVMVHGRPSTELASVPMSASVETSKHFISVVTEQMTGIVNLVLNRKDRSIPARERGLLSAMLPDVGLIIRQKLEEAFTYLQLNALRVKTFYYLKSVAKERISDVKSWSDFQVGISQVIPGSIYNIAAVQGVQAVLDSGLITAAPALVSFLTSKEVKTELNNWLGSILGKIRQGGVPYDAILQTDPNTDPFPQIPNPRWFEVPQNTVKIGGGTTEKFPMTFTILGGGGLRGRRPLYSNASEPTSSDRRGIHEGLRKRTGSRTTPRVRQRTRKPRTRRQRKHLDRV